MASGKIRAERRIRNEGTLGWRASVVTRVSDALNDRGKPVKGSRILLLGAAYKPDVDDCRESPTFELIELLQERGANVAYNDPHVPTIEHRRGHDFRLESTPLTPETLTAQDCMVIVTDHAAYDWNDIAQHAPLLVDTRGCTRRLSCREGTSIVMA